MPLRSLLDCRFCVEKRRLRDESQALRRVILKYISTKSWSDPVQPGFKWFPGMAAIRKKKSIAPLNDAADSLGIAPLLEISSKSEEELGVPLSAFNLNSVTRKKGRIFSVETAFQGSKVFKCGAPYTGLMAGTSSAFTIHAEGESWKHSRGRSRT